MFDAPSFLEEFNISYQTEGNNISANWIGINCPFCNDPSEHGGFSLSKGYYHCFRCGAHKLIHVIIELAGCNLDKAKYILERFSTEKKQIETWDIPSQVKLPIGCTTLQKQHRKYLVSRNFNPDELIEEWDLQGTGPVGDYKHRIIAPVYLNKQLVSFQGRDITDRQSPYKACGREFEIVNHRSILYGAHKIKSDTVIIVEGITDVWRLGIGAAATFGIEFTQEQIAFICKHFNKVIVLFDKESQALRQARKLGIFLMGLGVRAVVKMPPTRDPGSMEPQAALEFKNKLLNLEL